MNIQNKKYLIPIFTILLLNIAFVSVADDVKKGEVFIISPLDGEVVKQTFKVVFAIKNFEGRFKNSFLRLNMTFTGKQNLCHLIL